MRQQSQIADAVRNWLKTLRPQALNLWRRTRNLKPGPRRLRLCESLPLG
jgi:hypothetical protein